jgi:hypothetical protein
LRQEFREMVGNRREGKLLKGGEALPVTWVEETKITDLDKAFGQDVFEEAADELLGVESAGSECVGVGRAKAESDLA